MMQGVPESHADRIERQDEKDRMKEVQARQKELNERLGEASTEVENPNGSTVEVSGAECPEDCDGVIVVVPQPGSYPPFSEKCTNGDCNGGDQV